MAERWRIIPTTRRTTKPDRVDILDQRGRFVAGYVRREDALRMIYDPTAIADEAIGLFLEFRDAHGRDEESARAAAVCEIMEGCAVDDEQIMREMAAMPVVGGAATDDERLPF